jgi:hypothetical protein
LPPIWVRWRCSRDAKVWGFRDAEGSASDRETLNAELTSGAPVAIPASYIGVWRLVEAGILTKLDDRHRTYYRPNPDCPIYNELRQLFRKLARQG